MFHFSLISAVDWEGKNYVKERKKESFSSFFCQKTFWPEKITLKKNNLEKPSSAQIVF